MLPNIWKIPQRQNQPTVFDLFVLIASSIWYLVRWFTSVVQLCLTLCDPMDCPMPGLPVHHQLLKFTHTHVHQVGDVIQPSHPLSSPFSPDFNLSQHQGLFK